MIRSVSYNVEFAVIVSSKYINSKEHIFITGNALALGNWMLDCAIPLEFKCTVPGSENLLSVWSCTVTFTDNFKRVIHYRFFVGQRIYGPAALTIMESNSSPTETYRLVVRNCETFRSPRILDLFDVKSLESIVSSLPDNLPEITDEWISEGDEFNKLIESAPIYGINEDQEECVHSGWLVGQSEIHLRFHSNPITIWKAKTHQISCVLKISPVLLDDDEQDEDEEECSQLSSLSSKDEKMYYTSIEVCSLNNADPGTSQPESGFKYNSNDYVSVKLQTYRPEYLAYQIDFYDGQFNGSAKLSGNFGQSKILPVTSSSEEKPDNRQYLKKVPIIRPKDNKPIGYVNIDVLIITSLPSLLSPHSQLSLMLANTRLWRKGRRTLHVGHRGSGANLPACPFSITKPAPFWENTVASFKAAQKAGVDMIEFDVQLTRDSVPIVFHDFQIPVAVSVPSDRHSSSSSLSNICTEARTGSSPVCETISVAIKDLTYQQLANLRKVFMPGDNDNDHPKTFTAHDNGTIPSDDQNTTRCYECDRNTVFPTLSEVFRDLDPQLGFNIEVKYAMQYLRGDFELPNYFERNLIVDRILECINAHASKRFILLSSFDPDCCLMLHKKQNRHPVIFLSQGEMLNSKWPEYHDVRARDVNLAIRFAASENLLGISFPADEIIRNPQCVKYARQVDLVLFSWEISSNVDECIEKLKELSIDGVICDEIHVDGNEVTNAGCIFMAEEIEDEILMRELHRKRLRQKLRGLETVLTDSKKST